MRSGQHWEGHPPDDPPQGPWCSDCERNAEDCVCSDEPKTNVERFYREIGLDQESAASWRKRWEAEQADKTATPTVTRRHRYCGSKFSHPPHEQQAYGYPNIINVCKGKKSKGPTPHPHWCWCDDCKERP